MIRGGSYEIEVTVVNEDTGTALDLTSATGILVALYNNARAVIAKWSFVDRSAEGFEPLIVSDAVAGKITLYLNSDESVTGLEKMAKLEVKVAFNNPVFDGSKQISVATEVEIEPFERSVLESFEP